ncbi:HMG-box, partial [Trametes coccinea BRFM310]
RPRNAFMIFRSEYCMDVKESQVEHDHRMISKILGEVWRNLEPERKEHYKQLAAEEKRVHTIKYPNYRFSPQQ